MNDFFKWREAILIGAVGWGGLEGKSGEENTVDSKECRLGGICRRRVCFFYE
jgi:hypothetical protein